MKKLMLALLLLLPMLTQASQAFEENQDYQVLNNPERGKGNKIEVREYFNYGCPWCDRLETELQIWLRSKPVDVSFKKVPAAFNPQWRIYAKAFYAADALGVADKVTPAFFDALHRQKKTLLSENELKDFFAKQGVSNKDFENAYSFSPGLEAELNAGNSYMLKHHIYGVPAIVVDGKYLTTTLLARGQTKRMIEIMDFLISKARRERSHP